MNNEIWVAIINWGPLVLILMLGFAFIGMLLRYLWFSQLDSDKLTLVMKTTNGRFEVKIHSCAEAQLVLNMISSVFINGAYVTSGDTVLMEANLQLVLVEVKR